MRSHKSPASFPNPRSLPKAVLQSLADQFRVVPTIQIPQNYAESLDIAGGGQGIKDLPIYRPSR